jgi:hypothetical protein
MPRSTKYTLSAALPPGIVVYNSTGTTAAPCDADTSASATAALRPLGVLRSGGAQGDEAVIAADGELVTVTVASAVADGDVLVCGDGDAGAAVSFLSVAASFADGDGVMTIGRAQAAAASGGTVTMLQNVQLIFASIPA